MLPWQGRTRWGTGKPPSQRPTDRQEPNQRATGDPGSDPATRNEAGKQLIQFAIAALRHVLGVLQVCHDSPWAPEAGLNRVEGWVYGAKAFALTPYLAAASLLRRLFREPRVMSRVCQVTGKRTRVGNKVARRGLAKKVGGVGKRITGKTKRKFKPNIQRIRVIDPEGRLLRLRVSTKVIKTGVIKLQKGDKVVTFPLVKAMRGRNKRALEAHKAGE